MYIKFDQTNATQISVSRDSECKFHDILWYDAVLFGRRCCFILQIVEVLHCVFIFSGFGLNVGTNLCGWFLNSRHDEAALPYVDLSDTGSCKLEKLVSRNYFMLSFSLTLLCFVYVYVMHTPALTWQ